LLQEQFDKANSRNAELKTNQKRQLVKLKEIAVRLKGEKP